jgi:electron transfer flavoprotein alpha subunit
MKSEVWIFAEQQDSKIKSVAYELVSEGRRLATGLGAALCAVCLGHKVQGLEQLISYGADKAYLLDDPALADQDEDIYTRALADLVRQHEPEILLAGATSLGQSFIPRVAALLQTGLAANCTSLEIDAESKILLQTRPAYGGSLMATVVCPEKRPQMCTIRPHVFKRGRADESRQGQIVHVDFDKRSVTSRTKVLQMLNDLTEKVKLEEADIIVCGGRGLGAAENFRIITELAEVLGAALGSSRPPVDDGWIPYSHQIGQTGKTISPKVYFACGVSGAPQHLAGMQTSDIIVAINEDPRAPIFEVATYGIVGDLFKVVPLLTSKLRQAHA